MSVSLGIIIGVMALTFILNIPVTYGMIAAGVFYLAYNSADIGLVVGQIMGMMYSSYVLIAIPLFIFTANIMNNGKVTDVMFDFARALIGRRRGALAIKAPAPTPWARQTSSTSTSKSHMMRSMISPRR